MIQIYTDGSCNNNKKGGYAFIILKQDYNIIWSDNAKTETTNNRMELTAVIESLKCLEKNESCIIHTDSQWVINCAQKKWKRNKNLDLWKQYDDESQERKIEFIWVKGHSGDKYNELCDKLAYQEMKK